MINGGGVAVGAARRLLEDGVVKRVPCVYDGFSARIAEQTGFPAAFFTGNAVSGSLLGLPDVGVLGMSENVQHSGHVARSISIPLICDADTGYGGVLNAVRTVREFEASGVAGIILEDQVTPKRCGILPQGIPVVSKAEHIAKIRAAVDARSSRDFLIVARTDARSKHGLEDAADRARSYCKAGADAALVVGANDPKELRYVADVVKGPLIAVIHETPPTTELTDDFLTSVNCPLAMHAGVARYTIVKALQTAFAALRRDGKTDAVRHMMASLDTYNEVLGMNEWLALESKYLG
jgi:2-methylisocitrate lyase-like PEP mutase family enzyme